MVLLTALLPFLPLILAQAQQHVENPIEPHPAQLHHQEARNMVKLDERGMPITATTTMWHMVTRTETVWVQPTDQAVFAPVPPVLTVSHSSSASTSSPVGSSSAVSHSAGVSGSHTDSSSHSVSASATVHVDSAGPSPTASSHSSSHSASVSASASSESLSQSSSSHSSEAVSSSHSASHSSADASLVVESAGPSSTLPAVVSASHTSHLAGSVEGGSATVLPSATAHPSSYVPYSRSSGSGEAQAAPTTSMPSSSIATKSISSSASQSSVSAEVSSSDHSSSHSASASHSASTTEASLTVADFTSSKAPVTTSHSHSSAVASTSTEEPSLTAEAISSTRLASSSSVSPSPSPSPSPSASPSPSPSASSSNGLPPVPNRILAGYYPDWSGWYLTPENVDYSRFDILDFAFAIPTQSGGLEFTQNDSSDLLHRLVKNAHSYGKRVKLSIGGWTGSKYFSTISADDHTRGVFVKSMVDAYHTYNLDGIDIDWEYPGAGGADGNIVSPNDSANYLKMLQDLRAALPSGALITLATQVWPFTGPNGVPLSDVRGFGAVIDWILIMNYDIWGSSSTPGPNAPLSDACGNSTQPLANAYASVSSWTQAGLLPSQITIGVPAYGYLQQSWATSLRQRDMPSDVPSGNQTSQMYPLRERRGMEKRFTTVSSGWSTTEGQVMWHDLVSQGALTKAWNGEWVGAGGFDRIWDECSSTPFLKSTQSGQIVTYDDPQSMSLKGQFAAQAGLRGCNVFSVDGDWTNGEWPLSDAVRSGLGLK